MSVKPILFNTEMVRAILDGRKSCTRRIVKPQKEKKFMFKPYCNMTDIELINTAYKSPYQMGDILYVRESVWQKLGFSLNIDGETEPSWYDEFKYVASDEKPKIGWNYSWSKRPSIHMPKKAARLWLRVTDVRVERLQEITEVQAQTEGCNSGLLTGACTARGQFEDLWNSTIKKSDLDCYGWNANPWVWVIEFERCDKPESEEI